MKNMSVSGEIWLLKRYLDLFFLPGRMAEKVLFLLIVQHIEHKYCENGVCSLKYVLFARTL